MTIQEVRNHEEYAFCMNKIRGYKKGFEFTLRWTQIPTAKANALKIIIADAIEEGYLEPIATTLSLEGIATADTYRKL